MAEGRLFRSPLLTFGSIEPRGVRCEWTLGLTPVGERALAAGDVVELHVAIDAAVRALDSASRVRFDIVAAERGVAAPPPADRVARLIGTGAAAEADSFPTEARSTVFLPVPVGGTVEDERASFAAAHPDDLTTQLLILQEGAEPAQRFHTLTWWTVPALPDRSQARLHFRVDVDGTLQAGTGQPLTVASAIPGGRTVTVELQREDQSPLGEAEFDAVFEGGHRVRGRTDAAGRASFTVPPSAKDVFRLFLVSYSEGRGAAPGPEPPEPRPPEPGPPGPEPRPPEPPPASRPEVVAAFAFDSSFPSPAVHAALSRVRDKAAALSETRLIVFGHTDKVGSVGYNVALSERRARTVLALLLDDRDMFEAVGTAEGWDTGVHQSMLWGLGCNPGAIDGNAGPRTRVATSAFQREYNEGVYHDLSVVERERPNLPVDGNLSPLTRAAIRDAYVAVAPHVRPERFAEPSFAGCGKTHLVSERDDENRRAVVAFLPAETDLSQSSPCDRYDELVGETLQDRRAPHFSDHQWLREDSANVHLSAATVVPDGTPTRVEVVRCERPVPALRPDSSRGGDPPALGPIIAEVPAEIRGGVCQGRWDSPPPGIFESDTWWVDHDLQLEIEEPADHELLPPEDPASGTSLLAADALHPAVFVVRAGDAWGVSGPPGVRLTRIRFRSDDEDVEAIEQGVAVQTDGSLVTFFVAEGLADVPETADAISLALVRHVVEPPDEELV